jgi:hypothetical protein
MDRKLRSKLDENARRIAILNDAVKLMTKLCISDLSDLRKQKMLDDLEKMRNDLK